MGFVACVAFNANGENPSLSCNFKAMEERIILRRCVLVVTLSNFCQIIFGYSIYLLITLKSLKNGSMNPLATLSCRFISTSEEE
jgi:hypothetical protein